MGNCLGVGSDDIVFFIGEIHISGAKTPQNILDKVESRIRCAMFDEYLWTGSSFRDRQYQHQKKAVGCNSIPKVDLMAKL